MDDQFSWGMEKRTRRDSSSPSFFLLSLYLVLLLFRPEDLYKPVAMVLDVVLHFPLVIAVLCLLSHILIAPEERKSIFAPSKSTNVLLLISLWALLTAPFGQWITGALKTFFDYWLKMLVLYLLIGNVLRTIKQVRRTVWVSLWCVFGVSVIAIASQVIQGASSPSGRLQSVQGGVYSGSNYLALTVLLVLPFALYLFFLDLRPLVRWIAAGMAGVFVLATLLTQSRGGALALFVIMVAVIWKLRRWGKNPVLIVGMLVLAGLPFMAVFGKGVTERFSAVLMDYNLVNTGVPNALGMALGSYNARVRLLSHALQLVGEHPLAGVGLGNFEGANAHVFSTGTGKDWIGCHNSYLQFATELGVPGIAMYLVLLWLVFKGLRKTAKRVGPLAGDRPELRDVAMFSEATTVALYGYVITSAFASVAYDSYFFLLAGLAEAMSHVAAGIAQPAAVEPIVRESSVWWPELARAERRGGQ